MKIYIDFDDVISETGRYFSKLAKELFGIDLPYSQFQFFNIQKTFGLSDEQYDALMVAGHRPESLLAFEEAPGASAVINRWLDAGHEVSVITGRPSEAYAPSRQWLDSHGLARAALFCVDKYGREIYTRDYAYSMTLAQLYAMSFDFAIEDSPMAFEHVAHFDGCTVAVYERPWNRTAELPDGRFVRCAGWPEIEALAEKVCPKGQ